LNIVTTPREDHQMEMLVEIELEKMEAARRRAARKIAEKTKIPGFRPGKAPYDVVRRYYGDAAITEEAIELLVDEVYPAALKDAAIEPAAAGQLENVESLEPPKFKFVVPLAPTVDLGEYKSVRVPYTWQAPGEEEVEKEIENLRGMYAKTESVDREVQDGDYVSASVVGRKIKAKDDEAPLLERNGFAFVAGRAETEEEFPFPGFAAKMIGSKIDETRNFTHKFAKDYSNEELAGQNVVFEATIKAVRAVQKPELNDEFAKKTGLGQSVEELRQRMRENVESESRAKYDDEYFTQVIDLVKAGATIKYPPQVLEHEIEHVIEDLQRRLAEQRLDFDTYLKIRETTLEKFKEEEALDVAKKRLERGLIMDEIARKEEIKLDEEAVGQEFQKTWTSLAAYDPEFSKLTKGGTRASNELINAVAADTANRMMTRQVLDRLKDIASGQDGEKPVKKAKTAKAEVEAEPVEESSAAKPAKKKSSKKSE
jgi:trigger factor